MKDIEKFTAALLRMRRPRIRLNPVDYERMRASVPPDTVGPGALFVGANGIEIESADDVPVGQMQAVEMDAPMIGPLVPMERPGSL